MRKKEGNKLQRFFKLIYLKLFRINDTPQKIALGFGLGVFLGILPGTGPIAALCCAFLFRLNRAAAFLGSLLTNTWLSIVTFVLSVKVGSFMMNMEWHKVYQGWLAILKDFHWANLFKLSVLEIAFPVLLGYFIISLCAGILGYIISLIAVIQVRKSKEKKIC
ncbi:MAG: DUF2062 domain-containing protein [Candidatus Omnitrophica bacterium]|nr:DUF2062 domain-containing protein [Candidatus Omnitrophota bacterium]